MEEIKLEQAKVLEDIIGIKWKRIKRISGDIFRVKIECGNIIGLGIIKSKLTFLPESICNLKSLEKLDLGHNQLTSLPKSIGNLKSLQTLDLRYNQLTTLPRSMGNLSLLKELDLWENQLKTLPESFGDLKSLQELRLHRNKITTLPESIGNLSSLQILNLIDNKLTTLPESIYNLTSLKKLDLRYNQFNQEFKKIFKMANGDAQFILRKILENKAIKKKYKEERFAIEKLIQETKFSEAVLKLNNIKHSAKENNLLEILSWTKNNLKICNKPIIKKSVLDLGIKFARLQIAEISEVCCVDDVQLIIDVVKDMIENKEMYAQYFSSTKSVAFDQQANIDEIDKLMNIYKDWEDKEVGKK